MLFRHRLARCASGCASAVYFFLSFFFLPSREQLSLPAPQPPFPVIILNRMITANTISKIPGHEPKKLSIRASTFLRVTRVRVQHPGSDMNIPAGNLHAAREGLSFTEPSHQDLPCKHRPALFKKSPRFLPCVRLTKTEAGRQRRSRRW